MAHKGSYRMMALGKMAGKKGPADAMENLMAGENSYGTKDEPPAEAGPGGTPEPIVDSVKGLLDNDEFRKKLEALVAEYSAAEEAPAPTGAPETETGGA